MSMHRPGFRLPGISKNGPPPCWRRWASRRLEAVSPQKGELSARPCVGDYWPGTKGRTVRAAVECTCATAGPPGSASPCRSRSLRRGDPLQTPLPQGGGPQGAVHFDSPVNHRSPPARHRLAGEGMGAILWWRTDAGISSCHFVRNAPLSGPPGARRLPPGAGPP